MALEDVFLFSKLLNTGHSSIQEALKAYRSKAESYLGRLEKSESEKAKAIAKAETGTLTTIFLLK